MMHNNGLVVAIRLANGKVVREHKDETGTVAYIPPGTEYGIMLKNLKTTRAVVSISIDGKDVLDGTRIIVEPNDETVVKGFLDASTNVAHNAFKVIEKTDSVRKHRGENACDGLVRVEFQFEATKPAPKPYISPYRAPYKDKWPQPDCPYRPLWYSNDGGMLGSQNFSCDASANNMQVGDSQPSGFFFSKSTASPLRSKGVSRGISTDEVITAAGSVVDQQFTTTHVGLLDPTKYVVIIQIKGCNSEGETLVRPILARTPIACPTCGRSNKSHSKFCAECGTGLI